MRKVRFIDCGANVGQSIDWIVDNFEEFDIKVDSFEPTPELVTLLEQKINYIDEDITIHPLGVSCDNSNEDFYLQDWGAKTGSSMIKGKESTNPENSIIIETIDICEWIENNCNFEEEKVILKLDIEGTEYEVVEKLLQSNICRNITALLIEWTPLVKIARSPDFNYTQSEVEELKQQSEASINLVLDWQKPMACINPLKEALNSE